MQNITECGLLLVFVYSSLFGSSCCAPIRIRVAIDPPSHNYSSLLQMRRPMHAEGCAGSWRTDSMPEATESCAHTKRSRCCKEPHIHWTIGYPLRLHLPSLQQTWKWTTPLCRGRWSFRGHAILNVLSFLCCFGGSPCETKTRTWIFRCVWR